MGFRGFVSFLNERAKYFFFSGKSKGIFIIPSQGKVFENSAERF